MARTVTVEIRCDICSSHLDPEVDGPDTHLGVADVWYTVDLCDKHRDEAFAAFDKFLSVGQVYRPSRAQQGKAPVKKSQKSVDLEKVRAWAKDNNVPVSERGRIAASTMRAYEAAHGGTMAPEAPSVGVNPAEAVAPPAEPDTATMIKLHGDEPLTPFDEGEDMMPGTSASLTTTVGGVKDVSPLTGNKSRTRGGSVRNPDGSPAGS